MGEKKRQIKRIVLDTNIFISALLFTGKVYGLVNLWKDGKVTPLVSREMLKEIIKVLAYPKFGLEEGEIESIINEDILPYIETVKVNRPIRGICPDTEDDIFLSCAVNGKADVIVSGDAHLLRLKEFEGIPVFTITRLSKGMQQRG